MNNKIFMELFKIILKYGIDILDDVSKVENLLNDYCPDLKPEINILVLSLKERIHKSILEKKSIIESLVDKLEKNRSISKENAFWVVEELKKVIDHFTKESSYHKIGIDLGTTNSVACYLKNGKFQYIKFKGKELLQSCILYSDKKFTVGEHAKKKAVNYPDNFIKSSKTFMGDSSKNWNIDDKTLTPTDVASEILREIKKECDSVFGDGKNIQAIITVPAYFNSTQRDETKTAGERAGFFVKQILTEPVSAAIAYAFEDDLNQKLFIFDLGGGTFDVSILEVKENQFDTIAIDGDNKLGGDDFDNVILEDFFYNKIAEDTGILIGEEKTTKFSKEEYSRVMQRLVQLSERCKVELSESMESNADFPNLFNYDGKTYNFSIKITREEFEKKARKLFVRVENITKRVFNDKKIDKNTIDKIVLVGGSAYIPKIREFVKNFFGKEPYSDKDLSKLVAMGATIIADDDTKGIMKVTDIISHSLGIEVIGGKFTKILNKDENYPIKKEKNFTTTVDFQKKVKINIFEGEDETDVENNHFYGTFKLDNIENSKAGVPIIEVSFEFDSSAILTVTATDLKTGASKIHIITKGEKSKRAKPKQESFDIVFVVDTTGSMGPYIKGVLDTCNKFADTISTKEIEFRLGFIGYGDEPIGERPTIYPLVSDIKKFKQNVASCPMTGGGDEPESTFEAIENAIKLLQKSENKKIIISITDASAHSISNGKGRFNESEIEKMLRDNNITTYVVAPNISYYKSFANNTSGKFYTISDYHRFIEVLNDIAVNIAGLKKI